MRGQEVGFTIQYHQLDRYLNTQNRETIINGEFCYFVGVTWPYTERLTTGFTKTELEMITTM